MMPRASTRDSAQDFDQFADDYETTVSRNVRVFGEGAGYFARYKVARIQRVCVSGAPPHILEIGCGVGLLTELLGDAFPSSRVTGLECSARSVELAASRCARLANVTMRAYDGMRLPERLEGVSLVVLANVLHHVEPAARRAFLDEVVRPALSPGGQVVVFEHNPYNPLTRSVVRDCAFDRDAHLLTRGVASDLLARCGFRILQRDYIVFFPRFLRAARRLEALMGWLPVGAQYMVVGRWSSARPTGGRGR